MGPLTKLILESEGYPLTEDGLLACMQHGMDNDCPGICKACRVVHSNIEPDARANCCEECDEPKVVSLLVLQGVI